MNPELSRLKEVVNTLSRNGLNRHLMKFGFAWYLPFFKRRMEPAPADLPQRLRASMEQLGGAYIKLGQMLSLRPDLIPAEYCEEFGKLLDDVSPEPLESVKSVIEQAFHHPVKDIFTHIDPRPLGSASIAQVHKARLKNGQAVAVKIRRPEAAEQFKADIAIMKHIALKVSQHFQNHVNPALIVEEFERYTQEELNFETEAEHIERLRANAPRGITVPKVYSDYTTQAVLTMQYLDGVKASELSPAKKKQVIHALIPAFIKQVFEDGAFHADLHSGNILLLDNGNIGLLDFGIVGHIDSATSRRGLDLYLAILARDTQKITEVLLTYGTPSERTQVKLFARNVERLVNEWWKDIPSTRRVTHLMRQLFTLCAEHYITLPRDVVLIGKAMTTMELTARQLDPSFNFVKEAEPHIERVLRAQKRPTALIKEISAKSLEAARALSQLPSETLKTVQQLKSGDFSLSLNDSQFRHLGKDINLSSNRVSYALVSASSIMASALTLRVGPTLYDYSVISIAFLLIASAFVLSLLRSISREHKTQHDFHST